MLVIFIVFFAIMSFAAAPYFSRVNNILNVISQIAVTAIIAIGQTYVIITAGIDLSVGSILALSGMLGGMTLFYQQNIFVAMAVAILTAAAAGLFNGLLVGVAKIPAFIVTLGTMGIASSLTYVISNGNSYAQFPKVYSALGNDALFGVPYYLILVILLFVIGSFVLVKTKLGRMLYAIGSNEEAVRLSGVNVKLYIVLPYVITGFLTGIAAIVNSSRLMAVDPTMGKDLQMDTLAAVVIGGTSLAGGRGSLFGTAIGVLLIGFLRNSLNLLGVNPFWQGTAVGGVIIVAVLAERLRTLRQER
jgi:ribose transport system permease protein